MSIAGNFLRTAARVPDKVFLVGPDDRALTYAEAEARALRFAGFLEQQGRGPGDRIVLTFPNSLDYLCAYLGTHLLGCTAVPVDYRSLPAHLDFVRRDTGAATWVSPGTRSGYDGVDGHTPFPADLDSIAPLPREQAAPTGPDIALIMYTSGTTGTPKGVCLTHDNLQHTIRSIIDWAAIRDDDRELTTLSLTHLFGLAHVHVYMTLGGTVIVEESMRDVPRVLDRLARHGATSMPGTPAGYKVILDNFADRFRASAGTLRYSIINSAPMDVPYVEQLLALLPDVRFYMYYGLTEASRSTAIHYNVHQTRLHTVGTATPGADVRVGSAAAPLIGEPGEVLVRGPHVMRQYWKHDSAEHFDDGWFRTGDLGMLDADGFLTWVGRVKEQINIDGLKVSPAEVEGVLAQHPRVLDVAVIGAPDPLTGQSVVAFAQVDGAADKSLETELRRFCKPLLEVYKIPRRVVFVERIPRTDSGKVKRLALHEMLP